MSSIENFIKNSNKILEDELKRVADIALISRICPIAERPVTLGNGPSAFSAFQPKPRNPYEEDGEVIHQYFYLQMPGDMIGSSSSTSTAAVTSAPIADPRPLLDPLALQAPGAAIGGRDVADQGSVLHVTRGSSPQAPFAAATPSASSPSTGEQGASSVSFSAADVAASSPLTGEQGASSGQTRLYLNNQRAKARAELVVEAQSARLDPSSKEYKELLAKARRRCAESPVYKDEKIRIRTSIFNPKGDPIPQEIKKKVVTNSYLLYGQWRREDAEAKKVPKPTREEIQFDWGQLQKNHPAEYQEWVKRSDDLADEQVWQLREKIIRLPKRKLKNGTPAKPKAQRAGDDKVQEVQEIDLD